MAERLVGERYNKWTKKFEPVYEDRPRHIQTITKTKIGSYDVTIWSSRLESDRALSCFMGPDAELMELVDGACTFGLDYKECIEKMRDVLEGVTRVTAYAVTDANGNGVVVELR